VEMGEGGWDVLDGRLPGILVIRPTVRWPVVTAAVATKYPKKNTFPSPNR